MAAAVVWMSVWGAMSAWTQAASPAAKMASAQSASSPTPSAMPHMPIPEERAAIATANDAEREREMKLLGVAPMQPSMTAYDIGKPGNVNYDEAKANPFSKLPDLMTLNNGAKVKTPVQWMKRRAEIKALFDEYVYGNYPAHIPGVTWRVDRVEETTYQGIPVIVKHIVGHTDNSADPAITVDIHADVVTLASTKGTKVPVIIGGGWIGPRPNFPRPAAAPGQVVHLLAMPPDPPDSGKLLLDQGWGFVARSSTEVQADSAAGMTKGIIGLVNKGKPRSLDDWGVLRAWAWGDSRILDYLQTDPDVDSSKVGITGHSRGGKAALVTEADDERFAIGYISSSGKGGAALYRRDYGESMGNAAAPSEFHWYAGNFLKYAAMGHTADELPVDSHEFIALIAPRPVFIGGGALITDPQYAPGDAWQDAQGMFMAAVAASPAWDLLGAKGLGSNTLPQMGTLIDSGDVAFRQHQWGHTPAPNWPAFIEFATKEFAKH